MGVLGGGRFLDARKRRTGMTSVRRILNVCTCTRGLGLSKCSLHPTPHTPQPTPYTLHPTPYTLHPTPYTPQPKPYTTLPAFCTLHPKPYTPHPHSGAVCRSVPRRLVGTRGLGLSKCSEVTRERLSRQSLHPAPCTLNPEPCTLNPAPCTLQTPRAATFWRRCICRSWRSTTRTSASAPTGAPTLFRCVWRS